MVDDKPTELDKGMTFAEFEEAMLNDATFKAKMEFAEVPLSPSNLKEKMGKIADYTQDSTDQFSKDTTDYMKAKADFELKWFGKEKKTEWEEPTGMSETTQRIFSWVTDYIRNQEAIHQRMMARAVQDRALQAAELGVQYDELAKLYGNPGEAFQNVQKNIEKHGATVKKAAAEIEEILGQLKLGKEK